MHHTVETRRRGAIPVQTPAPSMVSGVAVRDTRVEECTWFINATLQRCRAPEPGLPSTAWSKLLQRGSCATAILNQTIHCTVRQKSPASLQRRQAEVVPGLRRD